MRTAAEFGAFGICAHIELDSGLEKAVPKFDAFKQEIFNYPNLLGREIAYASNSTLFSYGDGDANRRNCAVARCATLGLEEGIDLAKAMSSDAHIIVTHNPNIAVLGDVELIIPLRGTSEVSVLRDRGSIDTIGTKNIVCTILEGNQKAFKRRQEVYGY